MKGKLGKNTHRGYQNVVKKIRELVTMWIRSYIAAMSSYLYEDTNRLDQNNSKKAKNDNDRIFMK